MHCCIYFFKSKFADKLYNKCYILLILHELTLLNL